MTGDRPYVDQRVTDLASAQRVATAGAARWHLSEPTLLRVGMNAIYVCDDTVLRVGHATAPANRSHELATMLLDHGIPVVQPIDGCATDIDGLAVTAWHRVKAVTTPVDWRAVGEAVARIHALAVIEVPAGYPAPSPATFPWWNFDSLLGAVGDRIDQPAMTGLCAVIDAGRGWADVVDADPVLCHGDVHPGNVMMTVQGPVLIDFDLLCRATPGWDHAMLTTFAARWGGDSAVYPAFAAGYGRSLAADETTQLVASLRNVAATLMRVRAGLTDPDAAAEAERRLQFWRGDQNSPSWKAQ